MPIRYDGDDELINVRTLKAIVRRFELPSDIFDREDKDGELLSLDEGLSRP